MTATISITQDTLTTALRGFLLPIVSTTEVFLSQQNLDPMPLGSFITMTPISTEGLSTNHTSYHDTGVSGTGTQMNSRTTLWRCQLDCYGDDAQDMANIIATLWRSPYACENLTTDTLNIQPLYAGEPHQTTMINAEQQFENRWTVDVMLQFNPVITVPQDFADQLVIGLVEIGAKYPPGA